MAFVGDESQGSGNNTVFQSFGTNLALIGTGSDGSGNNTGIINVATFPNSGGGNCGGPACFNLFGAQFFGGS
jgi:hypothetical protein